MKLYKQSNHAFDDMDVSWFPPLSCVLVLLEKEERKYKINPACTPELPFFTEIYEFIGWEPRGTGEIEIGSWINKYIIILFYQK